MGATYSFEFGLVNALRLSDSGSAEAFTSAQNGAVQLASRAHIRHLQVAGGLRLTTGSVDVYTGGLQVVDGLQASSDVTVAGGVAVIGGTARISTNLQMLSGGLDVVACQMQVSGAAELKQGLQVLDGVTVAGGADVAGGLTLDRLVAPSGVETLAGGISVEGSGLVHGGLVVPQGSLAVTSGGLAVFGGFSTDEGLAVTDAGVQVHADGIQVRSGGLTSSDIVVIRTGGVATTGAINVRGSVGVSGGVDASGSLRVAAGGLDIHTSGMAISGGVSVMSGGVEVSTGGLNVVADGLRSAGGARVVSGGMSVQGGGISVNTGGASSAGGVHVGDSSGGTGVLVRSGGLVVQQEGAELTGGLVVMSGGVTTSDGLHVNAGGTSVLGGLTTDVGIEIAAGGARVSDGGVSINDAGTDRLVSIRARSSVELALVQFEADSTAVSFHGTYTGSPSGYLDVVIDNVASPAENAADTFMWRKCEVVLVGPESRYDCTDFVEGIPITAGISQLLTEGVFVTFANGSGHTREHGWVAELTATDPVSVTSSVGQETLAIGQDGSLDATRGLEFGAGISIFGGFRGADGASISGGILSKHDVFVKQQGIRVESGSVLVSRNGLRSEAGMTVQDTGYATSGGAMMLGGLSVDQGLTLVDSDLTSNGDCHIACPSLI
jgi:hypothetical protein